MKQLKIPQNICAICFKQAQVGFNRPHSLHKTKRVVKPNLQAYTDSATGIRMLVCTRCIRTQSKKNN